MGIYDVSALALAELSLEYHASKFEILTVCHNLGTGQWQMDSLTGAVASQIVTEASKGTFSMVGNHSLECKGIKELNCDTYK